MKTSAEKLIQSVLTEMASKNKTTVKEHCYPSGGSIETSGNGAFVTIKFSDGRSVFLQGDDVLALENEFGGTIPTWEEFSKSTMCGEYESVASDAITESHEIGGDGRPVHPRKYTKPSKNEWGEWESRCYINGKRYEMGDIHQDSKEDVDAAIVSNMKNPHAPLVTEDIIRVKVTTDKGTVWKTRINGTIDDAKKHFLGHEVNVSSGGAGDEHDKMEKIVDVVLVESSDVDFSQEQTDEEDTFLPDETPAQDDSTQESDVSETYTVNWWAERDRASIVVSDSSNETVWELWDEEVSEFLDDNDFKWDDSDAVIQHLMQVGVLDETTNYKVLSESKKMDKVVLTEESKQDREDVKYYDYVIRSYKQGISMYEHRLDIARRTLAKMTKHTNNRFEEAAAKQMEKIVSATEDQLDLEKKGLHKFKERFSLMTESVKSKKTLVKENHSNPLEWQFIVPEDCVLEICQSGSNDDAVQHWVKELKAKNNFPSVEVCRKSLQGSGIEKEAYATDEDAEKYALWSAAWTAFESESAQDEQTGDDKYWLEFHPS